MGGAVQKRDGGAGRAIAALSVALALVAPPEQAFAGPGGQPASAKRDPRNEARVLGQQALKLYDRGEYAAALEKFERAYALYAAPTLGLHAARCLEKLGRLVAAVALYREVAEAKPTDGGGAAFRTARAEASKELAALLPRVPKLAIRVETEPGADVKIALDGEPLTDWHPDEMRDVDPGPHEVEVSALGLRRGRRVVLAEGQSKVVTIELVPEPEQPAASEAASSGGSAQRTAGWVLGGLGAAGLVVWGAAGGIALGKRGDLDDAGCKSGVCPKGSSDDIAAYDTARLVSSVGFYAGLAALGLGVTLIATAPSSKPAPSASVSSLSSRARGASSSTGTTSCLRIGIGPTGASLSGSFF